MVQQKTAQKTFVLDTDVLLTSPFSVYSFDEHIVIVVDATIEDLNRAKEWNSEQGRNARETIRFLEDMAQKGSIINGVPLPGGGTFRIHCKYTATPVPLTWDPNDPQTRILRACKSLDDNVILVTNNMVMRLKADMLDPDRAVQDRADGRGREAVYRPRRAQCTGILPEFALQKRERQS